MSKPSSRLQHVQAREEFALQRVNRREPCAARRDVVIAVLSAEAPYQTSTHTLARGGGEPAPLWLTRTWSTLGWILTLTTNQLFAGDDPDLQREGDDRYQAMDELAIELFQMFTGIIEDRRANPTDDLASLLAKKEIQWHAGRASRAAFGCDGSQAKLDCNPLGRCAPTRRSLMARDSPSGSKTDHDARK